MVDEGGAGHGLRIAVLGAPIVEVGGRPAEMDTRKAVALLAYLAVTARPHRREALAVLLWPEAGRERAAGALRRTLSALRSGIGADRLAVDRATVALVGDAADVDLWRAAALVAGCDTHGHDRAQVCARCAAPLGRAAALHRGGFLEGFGLRDSAAFDDWQFFTGEELRRELASLLERLARACELVGDVDGAVGAARRWLALDPLHEPAHRELIRLHAAAGQHAAALRQYRECVRILDRELGVSPLDETTAAYEEVVAGRGAAPQRPPPPPPPPVPLASPAAGGPGANGRPFVGRSAALERLVAAIAGVGADGVLVVVEGEPGIGKTRLLAEALRDPHLAGRAALTARAHEGEAGIAYGLVADALRSALEPAARERLAAAGDHALAEAARLVPELADARPELPAPPPLDGPGAGARFTDGLGRVLAAAADVLVVEDLQWADEASLDVLTHLVRRLRGRPVAVVATWRTEAVGRDHRLRRLVADARREDAAVTLVLERLSPDAVAELVAAVAPASAASAARVHEETEGVALLVVEVAAQLAADAAALDGPLPVNAREVLRARLAGVGQAAGQVLATAAVIGRSFDLDTVREASGRSEEETATALEELAGRGIVAELPGGAGYDFTHAQLRALAQDDTGLARRRLLHRRVADALAARARRARPDAAGAGVVAAHYAAAGRDADAAAWEAAAGDHAAGLLAFPEAVAHYEAALALGHPDTVVLQEALGDLATRRGRYADARASYQAAAASAGPGRLAALEHKLGGVYAREGEWLLADRHYADALTALADGAADGADGLPARVLADRSLAAHRRGSRADADALAQAAMEQARAAGDPLALAQAHNLLGILAHDRGDDAGARLELGRSLALARELGDAGAEVAAANNLALATAADGAVDDALRIAEGALARSAQVGDRHRQAAVHNNLADLSRLAGDHEASMRHLRQAVVLFAEVGEPGVLSPEIWKLAEW